MKAGFQLILCRMNAGCSLGAQAAINQKQITTTMNVVDINSKYIRSYATRANLRSAIEAKGLDKVRHIEVCTAAGRYTAIFSAGGALAECGSVLVATKAGFVVFN